MENTINARQFKEKNPHGIQFSMVECSTCPSCSKMLEISKDLERVKCYHLKVSHVPEKMKFRIFDRFFRPAQLAIERIDKEEGNLYEFVMHPISINGFGKGESFDYHLASSDFTTMVRATAIPYPIEARGKDGAHVSAIILDLDQAQAFLIEAKNFLPNETIKTISTSHDEVLSDKHTLPNGEFSMIYSPAVIGKKGGIAKFEIVRADENLSIEIPWGQEQTERKENEPFVPIEFSMHFDK